MTDEQLIQYNRIGLIPGPGEDLESFEKRVNYCLNLRNELGNELQGISYSEDSSLLKEAAPITQSLFDIDLEWTPVILSNDQLMPWHGGAACIFQSSVGSTTGAFLQLRKAFVKSRRYLGLYDRDELIAHEAAHIGRMAFDEPKFEELLAYRTAKTNFRRWFGSIIQSATETLLLFFLILLSFFVDLFLIFSDMQESSIISLWFKAPPLLLILAAFIRLMIRQRQFSKTLSKLKKLLGDEKKANGMIYRLDDAEIILFSKLTLIKIKEYIPSNITLRWHVIKISYIHS